MKRNQMARVQKYFCCGHCFGDLVENDGDLECRRCGCKVFVTQATGEIKTQKALTKNIEIRHKVNKYNIEPWAFDQTVEESIAELGF